MAASCGQFDTSGMCSQTFGMTMIVDIRSLEGPYKNSLDELWTMLAFA